MAQRNKIHTQYLIEDRFVADFHGIWVPNVKNEQTVIITINLLNISGGKHF